MRAPAMLLALAASAACGAPANQPRVPAPVDPSAARQQGKDAAISQADALLEDLKRREAAQQEFDLRNPVSAATPELPPSAPLRSTPEPATASAPAASADAPIAPPTQATEVHDWAWWQKQSQSLQQALEAAQAQLAEANRQNLKNGYGDAQLIYKQRVEAVSYAHAAIDKLHEDARRAGVPAGWLR